MFLKKRFIVVLFVTFIFMEFIPAGIFQGMNSVGGFAASETTSAIEDAYVVEASSTTNYGSTPLLYVKSTHSYGYSRQSYIKDRFTSNTVTRATLNFYVESVGKRSVTLSVYGLPDDNWNENEITWDNKPETPEQIYCGSLTPRAPGWYSVDVTSYVKTQLKDKVVSFLILDVLKGNDFVKISSREGTYKSYLEIDGDDTASSGTPKPPTDVLTTPSPTPTPADMIFSEGFEVRLGTIGRWTKHGISISTENAVEGRNSVAMDKDDYIEKNISTEGYHRIQLEYFRLVRYFESGDHFFVQWTADGINWITLEDTMGSTAWTHQIWQLPSSADNNANFKIRFAAKASAGHWTYVDNVILKAKPLSPMPTPVTKPTASQTNTPSPIGNIYTPTPTATKLLPTNTPTITPVKVDIISFRDIKNHWVEEYIKKLQHYRFNITGYKDGTLKPNNTVSRAEMAVLLSNFIRDENPYKNEILLFKDSKEIPPWAEKGISFALQKGFLKGYQDNTFKPFNKVSRKELIVIAMRAFGFKEATAINIKFTDSNSIPKWALGYIIKALELGIIEVHGDKLLKPDQPVTRAETFAMICNCIEVKIGKPAKPSF
ncbi:MAG: S-layer homology domain-containing protein [Clostridia bacterium]|nr:S-layer homology domain-containing protein [Clostridia bacterium]